jgi:hypothetical protein
MRLWRRIELWWWNLRRDKSNDFTLVASFEDWSYLDKYAYHSGKMLDQEPRRWFEQRVSDKLYEYLISTDAVLWSDVCIDQMASLVYKIGEELPTAPQNILTVDLSDCENLIIPEGAVITIETVEA